MKTVLVIDDDEFNLEIIKGYLSGADIETVGVALGEKALSILQEFPNRFSAILLDRMMPEMDGMEVLSKIKSDKNISHIPVIMQTGKEGKESMLEGLTAGAHYYVTKPYDNQTLIAIVSAAIRDYQSYTEVQICLKETTQTLKMLNKGLFSFKSLSEARNLAAMLANTCPNPDNVILGLTELMVNALEHGNLGISYDEKSDLNDCDEWEDEVTRRLSMPSNKDKQIYIEFCRNDNEITFLITDQGDGFDWHQYMDICPSRAFDSHGRGIAMANLISFDQIEYLEPGNQVCVTVSL